jgi:hypothetical protein
VAVGIRAEKSSELSQRRIVGFGGIEIMNFDVPPPWRLGIGLLLIGAVMALPSGRARNNKTLRDDLLRHLSPKCQTCSLARRQMASWFTLTFSAYTLLFQLIWDTSTISARPAR